MKINYCYQMIQRIQKITSPVTERISQTGTFLSKLFSVKNSDQYRNKATPNPRTEHLYQRLSPSFATQCARLKPLRGPMPMLRDMQFSTNLTGAAAQRGGNRGLMVSTSATSSPSVATMSRKPSVQPLPLRSQITSKDPVAAPPVKLRRAPLPPLTPKMISQLEQIIKQTSALSHPAEQAKINIEQLTPEKMEDLKLALKDFAVNPQMARDKWINSNQKTAGHTTEDIKK